MLKYLYAKEPNKQRGLGVEKKIIGQVKALNKNGIQTIKDGENKLPKWRRAIPFSSSSVDWRKVELNDIDTLYIRYHFSDYQFIKFLKKAKSKGILICIENAVYPYEHELKKLSILGIRDRLYSRFLKNYVDHIFYTGGGDSINQIHGIECEKLCNGIDFNSIRLRNIDLDGESIRLIAVADFQKSHGYERIIKGISDYLKSGGRRRVDFYLVGDGDEKTYYESLTKELDIGEFVHFMGKMVDDELDRAYDNADIGVEVFGFYKRGIKCSSSLKSREYLARGLPFICGAPNDVIDIDYPFCLFFENDDSIVDLTRVIDFYDQIYGGNSDKEAIAESIREYGMQVASWEKTMQPVSDYVSKHCK